MTEGWRYIVGAAIPIAAAVVILTTAFAARDHGFDRITAIGIIILVGVLSFWLIGVVLPEPPRSQPLPCCPDDPDHKHMQPGEMH